MNSYDIGFAMGAGIDKEAGLGSLFNPKAWWRAIKPLAEKVAPRIFKPTVTAAGAIAKPSAALLSNVKNIVNMRGLRQGVGKGSWQAGKQAIRGGTSISGKAPGFAARHPFLANVGTYGVGVPLAGAATFAGINAAFPGPTPTERGTQAAKDNTATRAAVADQKVRSGQWTEDQADAFKANEQPAQTGKTPAQTGEAPVGEPKPKLDPKPEDAGFKFNRNIPLGGSGFSFNPLYGLAGGAGGLALGHLLGGDEDEKPMINPMLLALLLGGAGGLLPGMMSGGKAKAPPPAA